MKLKKDGEFISILVSGEKIGMETPENKYIDEHFLERLRKQRQKQAEDIENGRTNYETANHDNETTSSELQAVNPTSNKQNDVSFNTNESEGIEESHLRSDDFLHKFNTFDNVIRYSFGTDLRNEEEDSYENDVFVQHEDFYENEMKISLEANLRNEEEASIESEEFYQSDKGFEGEIHNYLNALLNETKEKTAINDTQAELENSSGQEIETQLAADTSDGEIEELPFKIRDYQQKSAFENNSNEDNLLKDVELGDTENQKEENHPNESYRSTVQSILESKKREFNMLGYESVNENLLWKYLIEKKWRKVKEPYRLHQVVADIYAIRPNDFMNHATVEVFKKSEPKSRTKEFTIDKDSLKGLF